MYIVSKNIVLFKVAATSRELRVHVFLGPDPRKAKLLDRGSDPTGVKILDPDPDLGRVRVWKDPQISSY